MSDQAIAEKKLFWKAIPAYYSLFQSFPPEYFRHKILIDINLLIAGSYLLRQGLFYAGLYFMGTGSPAKGHLPFEIKPLAAVVFRLKRFLYYCGLSGQKTRAEHGAGKTVEKQTLFSKIEKNNSM